jgi:serine/threonine protein kinase
MIQGFTKVKKIAKGINGDIFEYRFQKSGSTQRERMAVKKLKNEYLNNRHDKGAEDRQIHFCTSESEIPPLEDSWTEICLLSYLARQPNMPDGLLRLHGVFADDTKPLTWLVTEFADGGELFNVAARGIVYEADSMRYVRQVLEGVAFIHLHRVAHRDISLDNILLKDGHAKLMDFGAAVTSHSLANDVELRYFRTVGKLNYRPPECYVPTTEYVSITIPDSAAPGQIIMVQTGGYLCEVKLPIDAREPGYTCEAEVLGYAATPVDIFEIGICLFILLFQCPPWRAALMVDQHFSFFGEQGLEKLLNYQNKFLPSTSTMQLLIALLQTKPADRPSARGALELPWVNNEENIAPSTSELSRLTHQNVKSH